MTFVPTLGSSNLAPVVPPADLGPIKQPSSSLGGITLTILAPSEQIDGPGGEVRVRLEGPTVGPADASFEQITGQLDSASHAPVGAVVLGQSVATLAQSAQALAESILADPPASAPTIADIAASFEGAARVVERRIRDVIESSTYPSFNDFLKELVKVAQELRESATEAKLAAIEANHDLMMDAANKMLEAAELSQESRETQIQAEKKEAIGQIVSGVVSVATSVAFGAVGIGYANSAIAQFGSSLSQALGEIIKGSTSLDAIKDKQESSDKQFEADSANVAKQRLEAAAKLIEQEVAIADEIRETAKALRDMVLKLIQDFISSQQQIIQRANV